MKKNNEIFLLPAIFPKKLVIFLVLVYNLTIKLLEAFIGVCL